LLEQESGSEEEAIARKEKPDEETRFGVDDKENREDAKPSNPVDKCFHYSPVYHEVCERRTYGIIEDTNITSEKVSN
jgi:hypothetical protein